MKDAKWIFFDVGGTLVNETKSFRRRVQLTIDIQKSLGKDYTVDELESAMKRSALAGGSYFRGAMKEIGISEYAPYDCVGEFLYPEVEGVLKSLYERYRLGIIANQPVGTKARLDEYGIGGYFSLVLSSAEEGVEKPDREIFLRALTLSGCEAADAVMVGDRPDNDILPAKALGMKTVRITQGMGGLMPVTSDEMRADVTISSLDELLSFFNL